MKLTIKDCTVRDIAKIRRADPSAIVLDITIKSGFRMWAPTWPMVMGYKESSISKEEYIKQYDELMAQSAERNAGVWKTAINRAAKAGTIYLACMCTPGEFCHRRLLPFIIKAFVNINNMDIEVDIQLTPETTTTTPTKESNDEGDGKDHINVYSKSRVELGRWMSNFAHTPLKLEKKKFASIEAFWYYLSVDSPQHDLHNLRMSYGFQAKKLGRELKKKHGERHDPDFNEKIKAALREKTKQAPSRIRNMLRQSTLPFEHYYVYGDIKRDAGHKWQLEEWTAIRKELQEQDHE